MDNYTQTYNRTSTLPVGTENVTLGPSGNDTDAAESCLTGDCIPIIVITSFLCICGIFANLLVIVLVCLDKALHKPTFVAIVCLSIADFTFILIRYISFNFVFFVKSGMSKQAYTILVRVIFNIIIVTASESSMHHIIFLSLMRYVIIAYPLRSRIWITNLRICIVSLVLWFVSLILGIIYVYFVVINREHNSDLAMRFNNIMTFFMTFVPIVMITVLYFMKAKHLRKSVAACKSNAVESMSKMVTFVLVIYVITTTPINVRDIIHIAADAGFDGEVWFLVLTQIGHVLLLLNYVLNPFIYFVHSTVFRESVKRLLKNHKLSKYSCSNSIT